MVAISGAPEVKSGAFKFMTTVTGAAPTTGESVATESAIKLLIMLTEMSATFAAPDVTETGEKLLIIPTSRLSTTGASVARSLVVRA